MLNKKIIYLAFFILIGAIIFTGCVKYADGDRKNPLDPGSPNYKPPLPKKVIIASDNFEYTGGTPAPFGPWGKEPSTGFIPCQIFAGVGITGNAVRFYDAVSSGDNTSLYQTKDLKGHFFIEFYIKNPSAISGEFNSSFCLKGSFFTYLKVGTDEYNEFFYDATMSGGGYDSSGSYDINKWYFIKIEVDLTSKKFSCWYKEKDSAGDPIPIGLFNPSVNLGLPSFLGDVIPRFEFYVESSSGPSTQETLIDNFEIYKME